MQPPTVVGKLQHIYCTKTHHNQLIVVRWNKVIYHNGQVSRCMFVHYINVVGTVQLGKLTCYEALN